MHWKKKIYTTAFQIAKRYIDHPHVTGIAIGGSIGRGETWKHSDLKLCLLVKDKIKDFSFFNVIDGMGVEILQLKQQKVEQFVNDYEHSGMFKFPIQIYKCKIVYDPKERRTELALEAFARNLSSAKDRLGRRSCRPALADLRLGLNDLLLSYYWHYEIVPRSQNPHDPLAEKSFKNNGQSGAV